MIEFYSLYSDRLNLNGDQANVAVLRKRLSWAGIESRLTVITDLSNLREMDPKGRFLMVGHGSAAAMRSFGEQAPVIRQEIRELAEKGWTGLAVGSGYELLFPDTPRTERQSDYADVPAHGSMPRLHGYVNSDAQLPVVQVIGSSFVCTMVHGPVIARTPELANWFFERMGVAVPATTESLEADSYAEGANQH